MALRDIKGDVAQRLHSPVTDMTVTGEIIGESEIVVVMATGHPLVRHRSLTPAELADEQLILNDPASPPTRLVYETFAAAGVGFRVANEANSSALCNTGVLAGHCVALIDHSPNHRPRPSGW